MNIPGSENDLKFIEENNVRSFNKRKQIASIYPTHSAGWLLKRHSDLIDRLNDENWAVMFRQVGFSYTTLKDKIICFGTKDAKKETPWYVSSYIHEITHALSPTKEWYDIIYSTNGYNLNQLLNALVIEERNAYEAQIKDLLSMPNSWFKNCKYSSRRRRYIKEVGLEKAVEVNAHYNAMGEYCQRTKIEPKVGLKFCKPKNCSYLLEYNNINQIWDILKKEAEKPMNRS